MTKPPRENENWLKSPINSSSGTIWLGGHLRDNSYISDTKMRILGRYALIFVLEGDIYYKDAHGRDVVLNPGHAILVSPDLPHAYGGVNQSKWSQSYLVFDGPQFDLILNSELWRGTSPFWKVNSIQLWNDQLKQLIEDASDQNRAAGAVAITQFSHLLTQLKAEDLKPNESKKAWLRQSMKLLSKPQEQTWLPPQVVANQVGLSYENFRKLFTEQTGLPPAKYQRQRKIDRACADIYRGSIQFKELAEELGFCDVYHFSKAFKQVKGQSPSAYRRSVQGE